jgi:catechol 2,3-dioxygenase-like lactoylglutathione lyase family enzyme
MKSAKFSPALPPFAAAIYCCRMPILALDHVQLAMPPGGEAAARHFYADLLGLAEVPKPENLAARGGCWFARGSVRVHLGVEMTFTPARKAHPAFLLDDLAATMARLTGAGFTPEADEPLQGYARVYVFDPFGNRLELMERLT